MYQATIEQFGAAAAAKAKAMRENPAGFLIASAMAGAYVGIGILLIFTLGQGVDAGIRPLVMGACFGIALTLVVFAGSELFTGHNMIMTLGLLRGTVRVPQLLQSWTMTWIGNIAGSALLAVIFYLGGGGVILKAGADLIFKVAEAKMTAGPVALFARGALCNWLVCLALWTSARTTNDIAKCALIWWCLFAFIACGFEHSVANMTIFSVALLGNHPDTVTLSGAFYNLLCVSLGNIAGGAIFVAAGYWQATGFKQPAIATPAIAGVEAEAA